MPIKLNINKFNAERNGSFRCDDYSKNLKAIKERVGDYSLIGSTYYDKSKGLFSDYVPEWIYRGKQRSFVAKVSFDESGVFYSEIIKAPQNIKRETMIEFNNYCIQIISTLFDCGFILSESEVETE